MVKFAHIADVHLGGWKHEPMQNLNFESFKKAIDILKETFAQFKRLKDAKIPCFISAGSHDYSVSGKTFLDVLEKAGFCKNVSVFEEKDGKIILQPTIHNNVAIYGYPGKKSGMEVEEIERMKIQDSPGLFKILMLHTTLRDAIGNLPIKSVDERNLPKVDYTALAHLHIEYNKEGRVYCGPTFPNNISELEDLNCGSFYIFDNGRIRKEEIKLRSVLTAHLELSDALNATEEIISLFDKKEVKDKIIILRLSGNLEKGKPSDIDFQKIESRLKNLGAFIFLKSTSKLQFSKQEFETNLLDSESLEEDIIKKFEEKNPAKFNFLIPGLIRSLQMQKQEEETQSTFEDRMLSETKKLLQL